MIPRAIEEDKRPFFICQGSYASFNDGLSNFRVPGKQAMPLVNVTARSSSADKTKMNKSMLSY